MLRNKVGILGALLCMVAPARADAGGGPYPVTADPFRQLEELLPTPTSTRAGSGAPGHEYWQQDVDYDIEVTLDDEHQRIIGHERIRYENNSPDTLAYLWLQLDANIYSPGSDRAMTASAPAFDRVSYRSFRRLLEGLSFDGSITLGKVTDRRGRPLDHTVTGTMMRIDLPKPLKPGKAFVFEVDWQYAINDSSKVPGRTGFERFDDGTIIYEIAQWFPRLAAYDDVHGWQNKQYLGAGEFSLEFGDYDVEITVPADHIVAATGELANPRDVLSSAQRDRLEQAEDAKAPMFIVTPEEAKKAEASKTNSTKTWRFKAENVRDFAFASSRKFIWDAQQVDVAGEPVWAMSYYPNEGEPLWSKYSTKSIIHTLDVYGRYAFEYPYPVAISVNGPVGGMEYPMICFNGPRPEKDGTYSKRTKYGLISVIIHEVGHNFFPMIVNSDERQWTWMDEGLNTFLQYRTEQEWEKDYPSRRGEPRKIVDFMRSRDQVPIMTNSESLLQFGNNAYAKTATALNILRETVMGREAFDHAFRAYAQRWKFRRPMPADFFRTMEDASAVDLDWFWRGWFYTTDPVDIAIVGVGEAVLDSGDPDVEKPKRKAERDAEPESLSKQRDAKLPTWADEDKDILDFYNDYDELDVTDHDRKRYRYRRGKEELTADEEALRASKKKFYTVQFENVGGLVMPIILDVTFEGGRHQEVRIPAEVWRKNPRRVTKLLVVDDPIVAITVDPHLETADIDLSNNHWPPKVQKSRFQLYKERKKKNPMQKAGMGDGPGEPGESDEEDQG
ncbi:MAG: M1 family metallopeptidase [Nannocystaceae bacterium]